MNWIKGIMIAGIAALTMGAATSAQAADAKTFPGTLCRAEGTTVSLNYRSSGRVENPNSGSMNIVCPVVRDAMSGKINYATVTFRNRNQSRSLSCTLNSRYRTAGSGGYAASKSKNDASAMQVLNFGSLSGKVSGIYFFRCTIPGVYAGRRSLIASYKITESY